MWKQIEPTSAHLTFLILSSFLICYSVFSLFIRNRLHLSEPPLALLTGIAFGPYGANALDPIKWNFLDDVTLEFTRVVVGIQVFVVGIELPKRYANKHWRSILWMLGPVMTFGWVVCAVFIKYILKTDWPTALVISACLTPTDPVLSASVLSESRFSTRVPGRIKNLLSCESGCNDGVSFPFLYLGISILNNKEVGGMLKEWFLVTLLWQCVLGIIIGVIIGWTAHVVLRYADDHELIAHSSFLVFYLLLAILSVGVGSTLGLDDFLVAFSAGMSFAYDGWFHETFGESNLNNILDLMINSSFFVYFGAVIPWEAFTPREITPYLGPGRLLGLLILVLLFRRVPIVIALKRFIPDIKTYTEAAFAGHFGPMGVGALFLAIEARAQLETETSLPLPRPDPHGKHRYAVELIWPVISFIVFGSTMVHGLSVAATSVMIHFNRKKEDRASSIAAETEPLGGMFHDEEEDDEEEEEEEESRGEQDSGRRRGNGRISLPT